MGSEETARENDGSEDSDVFLDVPVVKVDEIDLEVRDLRARVSLRAEVLDLVKLHVGADVGLGETKLTIKGVEAQALLKVRLDNVAAIVERVLQTLDNNPQILDRLAATAESAVGHVAGGAEKATSQLGQGAGKAVGEVGQGAGKAVGEVGEGAGEATSQVGGGAGKAVGQVGEGAGEATSQVGQGAGKAAGEVGEGAGEAASQVGEGAGDAASQVGEGAGKAAGEAGDTAKGAGEATTGDEGRPP